ncbi:MAG: NAD(P)-binding domain-containing protein [Ferruginibacter sp.]|nr:NAD(P)-binding domain-containing protein [Ferruginibacter sp.]
MKIGIIGTGNIGTNLARLFVKAGHEVILSWSRSPQKLIELSIELGNHQKAKAASVLEAVQDVDISILSVRFAIMDEVKAQMGNLEGKIIVDTNNPYDVKLQKGFSAAAEVKRRFPGIKLVKAFNTLYYALLLSESFANPPVIIPVSSDEEDAKDIVVKLIRDIGFVPFDIGGLENVLLQEPGGPFFNKLLTADQAKELSNGL